MKILADTHLLLWLAGGSDRLSPSVIAELQAPTNEVFFSTVSVWEASIRYAQGRPDFPLAPGLLHRNLLEVGYKELLITSEHAIHAGSLPPIHRDPFDRLLVAQAQVEGLTLLTSDALLAGYSGVRRV